MWLRVAAIALLAVTAACGSSPPAEQCRRTSDCPSGETCIAGSCEIPTGDGGMDAGPPDGGRDAGSCAEVLSDPMNCGACGHSCGALGLCIDGECQPQTSCNAVGCPAARTWCDTTTGVCQTGCASDAACGTGRLCDQSTHQCVPAPADCLLAACPAGHVCTAGSGLCEAGCQSSADCEPGASCNAGHCTLPPPGCASGACPGGTYCDPASLTCLPGCAEGFPCADGAVCNVTSHVCGAPPSIASCLTNECLTSNDYCDAATGACHAGCAGTAACPAGDYCDPTVHECRTPPSICPAAGCPYGSHCGGGKCIPGCSQASDCGFGSVCVGNACEAAPADCSITGCVVGQFCSPRTLSCEPGCTTNADCPGGSTCETGSSQCIAAVPDCTTVACPGEQTCDPGDGLCKLACTGSGPCGQGGTCDSATGTCTSPCSSFSCAAGNRCLLSGACVAGCSIPDFPCGTGMTCNNATHTCVPAPPGCAVSCAPGTYCDSTTRGQCIPGCDALFPCAAGLTCDVIAHECYPPDTCASRGNADCGGNCVDLATSAANCSDCGVACPLAMPACANGSCYDPCPGEGKVNCGGTCTLTNGTDAMNCGACGHICPEAAPACMAGTCIDPCPAEGKVDCGGVCASTMMDPANCGTCGTVCPSSTPACVGGHCSTCGAGQLACADGCASIMTDPAHCGTCNNACTSNQICSMGACSTCASGEVACDNACTSTQTDPMNCGACGTVCPASMSACVSGSCACPITGVDGLCHTLAGSYLVQSGPLWNSGAPTYSCVQACALLFGGAASQYSCSTQSTTVNQRANESCWGEGCSTQSESYSLNTVYTCTNTTSGCACSAYVNDSACGTNYCFRP